MEISQVQIDYCMECGVCTGSCPISRYMPEFSPRQIIKEAAFDQEGQIYSHRKVWVCLTCARCSTRCPVDIDFPMFSRSLRLKALAQGNAPHETHHGIFKLVPRIQMKGTLQDRLSWANEAGRFKEQGEIFYFVGCLPYYEIVFRYLDLTPLDMARSSLRLLNSLGIEPVLSSEERCCGHDAFWNGDMETFEALARWNVDLIVSSGAKTVLFSCPEGYSIFKYQYEELLGSLPFEVVYMAEFLDQHISSSSIRFRTNPNGKVTYQDPCRLGRMANVFDAPRNLINLIPEIRLVEMARNRHNALCCGTTGWIECSTVSKQMQIERLNEALSTGASTLITACPKCQIHLTCAQENTELNMDVMDIYSYLFSHME